MTATDFANSDVPVVLTIASSDSGAGTGVQADLKVFQALEVYGTCAITAVTAQTPSEIHAVEPVSPELLRAQIQAVSDGFPISAAKTGMLLNRELVEKVADADVCYGIPILVVDPRMVASNNARIMDAGAVEALKEILLPLARVVTPNIHEAEILAGITISSQDDLRRAARTISERYDIACVAKGGDLPGDQVLDVLYDEGELSEFILPRIGIAENHGAGCTFSAALTAYIAKGLLLPDAVFQAKILVHNALVNSWQVGHHQPLHLVTP